MSGEPRKLPKNAYEIKEGETYLPYTHGQDLTEFSLKSVLTGMLLGVVFGSANVYLGLMAGLTISTSIPVAVLSVVVFRLFSNSNILETNMSQTIGSASSSVASGALFTLPALFLWSLETDNADFLPSLLQMTMLTASGGLLGILAMIPLRRYLIKKEHGKLLYPEGMACAEVLVASEQGGKQAIGVFWGLAIGILAKITTSGLQLVPKSMNILLPFKAKISVLVSPALLGVGYILGPRIGTIMVAGSAISALLIIPGIFIWGQDLATPLYPETEALIRDMSHGELWHRYVRYIGAGAVATAGIITLIQSIPAMVESFKVGLSQIGKNIASGEVKRTDQDLSLKTAGVIAVLVLLVLTLVPGILGFIDSVGIRAIASVLIAVFAFFFVTVSSRIVGMIGVTSNPTSGMTIATLIGTSLIFLALGQTDLAGKATALMVGTVVCVAASIAGDTSQDLKTGFILGATPRRQQIGELVGVLTSAVFVCGALMLLHEAQGLGSEDLPAPQAALMKLVIDGVIDQQLPWNLVFIGMGLSLAAFALKLPTLPFAVGVYLPMSTMAAVFLGGMLRHLLTKGKEHAVSEKRREKGVLFASGLVGGEGLAGVLLALWVVVVTKGDKIKGFGLAYSQWVGVFIAAIAIAGLLWLIRWNATRE